MQAIDLQDLRLEVQAEFADIVQSFFEDLAEPTMTKAVAMRWTTLADGQKEMIKQQLPNTYNKIASMVQP